MPLLRLEGVPKSVGPLTVTDDVSFAVEEGEALGIIGPYDAGKSTLFNLIAGTLLPGAGRIGFPGRNVARASAMSRCLMDIGRSFQIPQPFAGLTVFQSLLVAAARG